MATKKTGIKIASIPIIVLVLILTYSFIAYSPNYMLRIINYGESDIEDYKIFPSRPINKADQAYYYEKQELTDLETYEVNYTYNNVNTSDPLEVLLEKTGTTAFIIISNDKLVYENYFNGYERDSINTSFSSAKSFVSLLVGMAIDDGFIQSVYEPITNYLTELAGTEFETITIEDLLRMRSPISYKEGNLWFGDDAKTYYMPDMRNLALNKPNLTKNGNRSFHYNNYHPLLLGLILERSTGEAVATYMEKRLWSKIGSEFDASWSLDSERSGFEKMESGINARAIDFAKVGSLILHEGRWQNEQLVSREWVKQSTITETPISFEEYDNSFLEGRNTRYGYMWYSTRNSEGDDDVFALGKYGQIIYVSPINNTVIVRFGKEYGKLDWWPDVFQTIITNIK
ncbi:serine hydrolase [Anaerobacillus sp. CMMVII]|uniref:serine hydrolase domain-containing protein n=1 Tax=Anaerobacillus sp. CMMVII TaxID=2755588 RepID=UPI0021B74C9C|nr:serine hydrolase [Anaerobacillus sp. CMMVII]MCT8139333.1 serine hydrolase [Anaerobacillus sp. CMMVII]